MGRPRTGGGASPRRAGVAPLRRPATQRVESNWHEQPGVDQPDPRPCRAGGPRPGPARRPRSGAFTRGRESRLAAARRAEARMARFPGRGDARGRGLRGHQQSQAVTRLATPPASPPPRGVEGPRWPAGRGRQEAQYVALGQMTSSPTPTPHAKKALCSAAVPVLHPSAYRVPCQAANSFSNATVTSSPDIAPRHSTSSTARSCSSVMMGHRNRSPGSERTAFGPPCTANGVVASIVPSTSLPAFGSPHARCRSIAPAGLLVGAHTGQWACRRRRPGSGPWPRPPPWPAPVALPRPEPPPTPKPTPPGPPVPGPRPRATRGPCPWSWPTSSPRPRVR